MKSQFAAIGVAVLLALFGNWTSSEDRPDAQRPGQHDRRGPAAVPDPVDASTHDDYDTAADGVATGSLPGPGVGGGVFDAPGPQLVGELLPAPAATPVWEVEPEVVVPEEPIWEIPLEPVPVEPVEPVTEEPVPVVDPVTGELVPTPEPDPDPDPDPAVEEPVEEPVVEDPLAEDPPAEDPLAEQAPAEEPSVADPLAPAVPDALAPVQTVSPDGAPAALGMVAVGLLWSSGGRRRPLRRTACAPLSPPSR